MNKLTLGLLLTVALAFAATAVAQTPGLTWTADVDGSYRLEWEVPPVERRAVEGGFVFEHPDAHALLEAGAPDVCAFSASVAWETVSGWVWEVESAVFEEVSGVAVVPSRGNLYRDVDPEDVPREAGAPYAAPGFWPEEPAALGDPFVWRGVTGQTLSLHPVQYRSADATVRIYTHMTLRFTPSPGLAARIETPRSAVFEGLQSRRFVNPLSADRYDQLDEYGRVLAIAPAEYFDVIAPWVEWKREKGYLVDVVDAAEAGSTPGQIGDYVDAAYAELGYSYLVLVGDEEAVPSELVVNGGGAGYCDPCYGYIEGDDHYPELLVGRMLAHDAGELATVVERNLAYEKTPDLSEDWFSKAIAIGSAEGTGIGDDGQNDWQHNNAIKSQLLDFTYTSIQELYDGSQGSSSPTGGPTADANGSPGPNQFANAVNAGASLINYTGHGSHNSIATTGFTNNDMDLLHNAGKWPYFIIVGCCVGDFDEATGSGDCFGEVWSKLEADGEATGGIGGSFSSVLQSWAPPMEGQDEMNALIAEEGGVATEHTLGGIHFHGCSGMVEAYGGAGEEMMDTWCLFGDPTNVLRTAMPEELSLVHDTEVPLGVAGLDVQCEVEGALVAATMDGALLGRGWVTNGQLVLGFEQPVTEPGTLLLTGTAFNHIPYQAEVQVVPAEGPYVVDESVVVWDASGPVANNGNGLAESGEALELEVWVTNVGVDTAFNVTGTLASSDALVASVSADAVAFGTLAPGASAMGQIPFQSLLVATAFTDGEAVWYDLALTADGGVSWNAGFPVTVHAPVWSWSACTTDDGNDGWLQPGETAALQITLTNIGSGAAPATVIDAAAYSGPVTVGPTSTDAGAIAPGASVAVEASLTVDPDAPTGSEIAWTWQASAGPYFGEAAACLAPIGLQVEDWEVVGTWPWANPSTSPWFETTSTSYSGNTAMQSGAIGGNMETLLSLEVSLNNWGEVRFARSVSSESGFDYLRFYVDGQEKAAWSGEVPWAEVGYPVFGGVHTLTWAYEKDEIIDGGSDAAWVDQIILPPNATVVSVTESSRPTAFQAFPNPATERVSCGRATAPSRVTVRDALGRVACDHAFPAGADRAWSVAGWSPGVYVITCDGAVAKLVVR